MPSTKNQLALFDGAPAEGPAAGTNAEGAAAAPILATTEVVAPTTHQIDVGGQPWPGFAPDPARWFSQNLVREIRDLEPEPAKELYREALYQSIQMVQTRLVEENPFRVKDRVQVRSPADVGELLYDYFADRDREEFLVIMLDAKGTVTAIHVASVGGLATSIVEPRQVFKTAVLCNAAAIVLAHNHPSGSLDPSYEDKAVTEQLVEAGKIMGIRVHDHIIIGGRGFTSLAEQWLL